MYIGLTSVHIINYPEQIIMYKHLFLEIRTNRIALRLSYGTTDDLSTTTNVILVIDLLFQHLFLNAVLLSNIIQ